MKSIRNRHAGRLALVALAVGAVFGSSQVEAASSGQGPARSSGITGLAADWSAVADLYELGDGTAGAVILTQLGPEEFLGTIIFSTTSYEVSVEVPTGQGGIGVGSGNGYFMIEEGYTFNPFDPFGGMYGPFVIEVEIAVTDARDLNAVSSQGITTQVDPVSGQTSVVRQHVRGNQASGATASSVTVWVDGVVRAQFGDGLGIVTARSTHEVHRIH